MEYWIVYDLDSGADLWRGAGPPGSARTQTLEPGQGIVLVPQAVVARPQELDLAPLRAASERLVDDAAEIVAQRFITPGTRKALTYPRKEAAARAWLADNSAPTAFLAREAEARGITIVELATEVVRLADAWAVIGDAIEAATQGAKTAIRAAANVGGIVTATRVDWEAILVPAA